MANRVFRLATWSVAAVLAWWRARARIRWERTPPRGPPRRWPTVRRRPPTDPGRQVSRVFAQRAMEGALAASTPPSSGRRSSRSSTVRSPRRSRARSGRRRSFTRRGPTSRAVPEAGASPIACSWGKVARTAVDDSVRGLVAGLGSHGQGPLAVSLAGTAKNVSAAAVGSALDQLGNSSRDVAVPTPSPASIARSPA